MDKERLFLVKCLKCGSENVSIELEEIWDESYDGESYLLDSQICIMCEDCKSYEDL